MQSGIHLGEKGSGDKMFQSQKHVFWQALLVTLVIFSLGIISGIFLENWRTNQMNFLAETSEISLLDIRLQSDIYSSGNFDCKFAIEENMKFADRIYNEAKELERYGRASILTEDLKASHKKYDLLRSILLLNSLKIKEKCNNSYYNVVYFYKYNNLDIDTKQKESVFSNLLEELKKRQGNKVLLIPIAVDNNLTSVDILMNKYGISNDELPVILINEKIKITELENINTLNKHFE